MLHKYLVTLYTVIVAYVSAEIYHGGGGSPFPFPVEELTADENEVPTGRRVRNAEWWKQFKVSTVGYRVCQQPLLSRTVMHGVQCTNYCVGPLVMGRKTSKM